MRWSASRTGFEQSALNGGCAEVWSQHSGKCAANAANRRACCADDDYILQGGSTEDAEYCRPVTTAAMCNCIETRTFGLKAAAVN